MLRSQLAARRLASGLFGGPCSARGFAAAAQERSRGPEAWWRNDQWNDPKALYDEVMRRFESSPPPGKPAIIAILERISKKEEAKLAVDAVDRFRREQAATGSFRGFGEPTTRALITACLRVGDVAAASSALQRHAALGLKPTAPVALLVVRAATKEGADATAAAYRAVRACGLALDPAVASEVVCGLSRGEGGGAGRAAAAAEAFEGEGVKLAARAWVAAAVAASSFGDAQAALRAAEKAKAAAPTARDSARISLVEAQAALLQGADAEAAGAAVAEAAKAGAALKPREAIDAGKVLAKWQERLGEKADEALKKRVAEAVAAANAKGANIGGDTGKGKADAEKKA